MKLTSFKSPYSGEKTNFPLINHAGVYIIKQKGFFKNVCYVGMSASNVYSTMYRHFQVWNDKRLKRITFDRDYYLVRVVYSNASQAIRLERALILKYQPKFNTEKYERYVITEKDNKVVSDYNNADIDDDWMKPIDVDL